MIPTIAATTHRAPDTAAIEELAGRIAGTVHRPGEDAYAKACAIWNAMIERRPALVVRPAHAADVPSVAAATMSPVRR